MKLTTNETVVNCHKRFPSVHKQIKNTDSRHILFRHFYFHLNASSEKCLDWIIGCLDRNDQNAYAEVAAIHRPEWPNCRKAELSKGRTVERPNCHILNS